MIEYLKKIGNEKENLKNLNYKEAFSAHKKVINQKVPDIQIGSFWEVMNIKNSAEEELKGFLDSTRDEINYIDSDEFKPLDLSINYDGKNQTMYVLPAAIFIATGAGAKMVGHGNNKVPFKMGITYHEILNEMGCSYIKDENKILKTLELSGFAFYHQKYYSPKLHELLKKRKKFGLKNYLNTIELFFNPFKTSKILIGASKNTSIHKYMEIAYYMGFNDVFIVKGLEGGIEPCVNKETKLYSNKILGINIYPKNLNIKSSNLKITSVEENAEICLSILKNKKHPLTSWAILTSALLLIAYGKTEDLKEAIDMSEQSLKLNIANEMFEIYKNISNSDKITV